jgi:hypothetical protein
MAVLKGMSVTDYVEDALRRKIDADNLEAGRQGYKVGQGGMYIPPPPASPAAPQTVPQQPAVMSAAGKPGPRDSPYVRLPEDFPSKKRYQKLLQVIRNGKEKYEKFKQRRTKPSKKEFDDFFDDLTRGIDNQIDDQRERSFVFRAITEDISEVGLPNLWAKNSTLKEESYEPPEERGAKAAR